MRKTICWLAYRAFLIWPLRWQHRALWLLPYAGQYAYTDNRSAER